MEEYPLRIVSNPPIGTVLLDQGMQKNVLSPGLMHALAYQVRLFDADPQIKVILIGSTASDVFSAGVDIRFLAHAEPEAFAQSDALGGDWRIVEQITKPVIAVVQGYCLGGGFELALMADVMILSTQATLGFPEIKLGLMPGLGGTQRLCHLIGPQRAALWVLSGRTFSASEAWAMGVGSCLIEGNRLWAEAESLARTMASYTPEALREARCAVRFGQNVGLAEGLEEEKQSFYHLLKTPSAQQNLQAFLNRRRLSEKKGS